MRNLIKHKVFIAVFLSTYFLFFLVTVFLLEMKRRGVGVGSMDYGFPFTHYSSNCFGGNYLWFDLMGNILVAAIFSILAGLVSTHF